MGLGATIPLYYLPKLTNRVSLLNKFNFFKKRSGSELQKKNYLKTLIGYSPRNPKIFLLALVHTSAAITNSRGLKESNERLEYLGDAILGSIVAEYLFKKFPYKDEGFLTEIRSRIVSRESLNQIGRKLGLMHVIKLDKNINVPHSSVYGDTLEALIGAVYLDRGFTVCRKFVLGRLIEPYFNLEELVNSGQNSKSRIIEWTQKENKKVLFDTINMKDIKNRKEFTVQLIIDNDIVATGYGRTKKKAEQDASQKAIEKLNLD